MLCFSDADECIFVKTMSHIRQAEKTLSIESAFNYSDLNGVLLFKLNRGFHTVSRHFGTFEYILNSDMYRKRMLHKGCKKTAPENDLWKWVGTEEQMKQ